MTNMRDTLFSIRNLSCQYPGSQFPALEIDAFDIYRGELVFFLGVSGVGKSTLIESLGLMNRTIVPNTASTLDYHSENETFSLFDLWAAGERTLSQFRSERYSFIFQESNLFEKLSLKSNAIIPALANNVDIASISDEARGLASLLLSNVPESDYIHKNAGSISGGQKQRLAFIQAIVSSHDVLFGDEPTGNLDWGNATKVMETLLQHIRRNHRTGLVVSHDIHLSTAFADRIVLLTGKNDSKQTAKQSGQILKEHVFTREHDSWRSLSATMTNSQLVSFLQNHFLEHAS